MIGKLIKYEIRSTCQVFLLLFAGVLLLALVPSFGLFLNLEKIAALSFIPISLSYFPLVIVFFVLCVQRYQKNLYGDEGYLTFTLPVASWEIILSKLLAFTIWGVLTILVGCLALSFMIAGAAAMQQGNSAIGYWTMFMKECFQMLSITPLSDLLWLVCAVLLMGMDLIMVIYAAISLSNIPIIGKWNDGIAVALFFVISWIENKILSLAGIHVLEEAHWELPGVQSFLGGAIWGYLFLELVIIMGLFILTAVLTKKQVQVR